MNRYLLVFRLPQPRFEHRMLKDRIDDWASSKPQIAFSNANADGTSLIGWLVLTGQTLDELSFDGCLFAEDCYFALELGERFEGIGFGDLRRWMWETNYR